MAFFSAHWFVLNIKVMHFTRLTALSLFSVCTLFIQYLLLCYSVCCDAKHLLGHVQCNLNLYPLQSLFLCNIFACDNKNTITTSQALSLNYLSTIYPLLVTPRRIFHNQQ